MNFESFEDTVTSSTISTTAPLRMLLLAVFAPFVAIGLMAIPLVLDAVRHALGA
jgi:hypothetical protein